MTHEVHRRIARRSPRGARAEVSGPSERAARLGVEAAERLLAAGADDILDALR